MRVYAIAVSGLFYESLPDVESSGRGFFGHGRHQVCSNAAKTDNKGGLSLTLLPSDPTCRLHIERYTNQEDWPVKKRLLNVFNVMYLSLARLNP